MAVPTNLVRFSQRSVAGLGDDYCIDWLIYCALED